MVPNVRKPHEYVILAYHRVNRVREDALTVPTDVFRRQLEYLLEAGYRHLTLEELVARVRAGEPPRGKHFALTFDDGYRDNHTDALPVLLDLGCRATFFLATDFIGAERPFPWDVAKFSPRPIDHAMGDAEVRALVGAGMSLGSHTCSHRLLTTLDRERVREEVVRSRRILESRFGVPVPWFCYPEGNLDDGVISCVAEAGYSAAVVTPPRPGIPQTMFTLRRIGIYRPDTFPRFQLKLHRAFSWVRELAWYHRGKALRARGDAAGRVGRA